MCLHDFLIIPLNIVSLVPIKVFDIFDEEQVFESFIFVKMHDFWSQTDLDSYPGFASYLLPDLGELLEFSACQFLHL